MTCDAAGTHVPARILISSRLSSATEPLVAWDMRYHIFVARGASPKTDAVAGWGLTRGHLSSAQTCPLCGKFTGCLRGCARYSDKPNANGRNQHFFAWPKSRITYRILIHIFASVRVAACFV